MIVGILPARYASTRFPAKALADLDGKPVIQRTYEQCLKAGILDKIIVATDHPLIQETVEGFGGVAIMTDPELPSGTDRCAEALTKANIPADFVINIQGDEPFVAVEQLRTLAHMLMEEHADIATLMHPISKEADLWNPSVVKAVAAADGHALYFSRQAIPFLRDTPKEEWLSQRTFYRHLGLYGFKTPVLKELTKLSPTPLEMDEKLEQLRWLESGYRIRIAATMHQSIGIDTPEDLETAIAYLRKQEK